MGCPNCTRWPAYVGRHVEHGLGQAERQGGDRDAPDLERAQELAESQVRITEEVIVGHPDVVEVELAGIETAPPDAAHLRSHGEARRVLLDDEARERRGLALGRLDAGQQCHAERHVRARVGDERLATVDQPAAVASFGAGADPACIGTGIGLGEPEGTEHAPLGEWSQPALSLGVVAEQVQRQRADRRRAPATLRPRTGRPARSAPSLRRSRSVDMPIPPHSSGIEDAQESELTHLAEQIGRAARLLPGQRRTTCDLPLREVAAEVDEVPFRSR